MQMCFPALDRHSIVPLYYQIERRLLDQIRSGELKPGDPVPSEHEIAAGLDVSRMTARQALKSLCELGVAYRGTGKGTFVFGSKLEKNFRQVLSFTEEMSGRRLSPSSKALCGFEHRGRSAHTSDPQGQLRMCFHPHFLRAEREAG